MKFILILSSFLFIVTISFGQSVTITTNNSDSPKSLKVKLKNSSFKSYHLYIPDKIEIESVKFGTNTFCLLEGQEIYFVYNGENHLLLTASSLSLEKNYNLPKLVRQRKNELGLK